MHFIIYSRSWFGRTEGNISIKVKYSKLFCLTPKLVSQVRNCSVFRASLNIPFRTWTLRWQKHATVEHNHFKQSNFLYRTIQKSVYTSALTNSVIRPLFVFFVIKNSQPKIAIYFVCFVFNFMTYDYVDGWSIVKYKVIRFKSSIPSSF